MSAAMTPVHVESILRGMVAPDSVMPGQWSRRTETLTGEGRLMLAIIEDAFRCLRLERKCGLETANGKAARFWFHEDFRESWGSLVHVCGVLDFSVTCVRRAAEKVTLGELSFPRLINQRGLRTQTRGSVSA